MKIIKLLYNKYILSLSICLVSSSIIFFIFSLLGNLNEEYLFNIIIKVSFLNSIQILMYVPAFIFLLSVILFIIFLRSKNEMIIIKSYVDTKLLAIFFLPIVVSFTVLELNKKNLGSLVEDLKTKLVKEGSEINTKIIIDNNNNIKSYTILKNINLDEKSNIEYRSFNVFNKKIQLALFSDNLIFSNNTLTAKSYTKYEDNLINDFQIPKKFNVDVNAFIDQKIIANDISKKNQFFINFKLINTLIFFTLYFSCVFLIFLNKSLVSTKYGLKNAILISLIILIYSFFIFNSSISLYRQEFELLGSVIVGLFFLKVYINE